MHTFSWLSLTGLLKTGKEMLVEREKGKKRKEGWRKKRKKSQVSHFPGKYQTENLAQNGNYQKSLVEHPDFMNSVNWNESCSTWLVNSFDDDFSREIYVLWSNLNDNLTTITSSYKLPFGVSNSCPPALSTTAFEFPPNSNNTLWRIGSSMH